MAGRESDSEEMFHSAGEEEVSQTPPPVKPATQKTTTKKDNGDGGTGKAATAAGAAAANKKSKGKKGKKKKTTPAADDRGDGNTAPKASKEESRRESDPPIVDSTQEESRRESDSPVVDSAQGLPVSGRTQDTVSGGAEAIDQRLTDSQDAESHLQPGPGEGETADQTQTHQETAAAESDAKELPADRCSSPAGAPGSPGPGAEVSPSTEASTEAMSEEWTSIEPEVEQGSPAEEDPPETGNSMDRTIPCETPADDAPPATDSASASGAPPSERSISSALGRLTGERPAETKSSGGGWGWGGWGSSLVSSVSAMGHGLSSVIENVESSLGLPKPQELTEQEKKEQEFVVTSSGEGEREGEEDSHKEEGKEEEEEVAMEAAEGSQGEDRHEEGENNQDDPASGQQGQPRSAAGMKGILSLGATAITSVVGKTVTGGLDALETIGRKTMDVLQEADHRAGGDKKTNLSEMLKDAKEEAETAALLEEEEKERQRAHFGILFDKYQGLAHLEALEMVSNQAEVKVQGSLGTLSGQELAGLKTELIEIRDAFQLEELESEEQPAGSEQDFVNAITEHLFGVSVASTPDKLQKVQRSVHEWLAECRSQQESGDRQDIKELHIKAIETLAEFSSRVIEQFHKACELMLLPQDKEHSKSPLQRATSLSKLTSVIVTEVSNQASKFADRLNDEASDRQGDETATAAEEINPLITNIYLEASNSTSYIQDAFRLVLPVLQMVAIERRMETMADS